jgi:DNA polymerase-3 subunit gamma/tau
VNDLSTGGSERSQQRGSYVVVARRYRPQTFSDLVGQRHVVQGLTSAIQTDHVGHAYLFTGVRGVGKTSAARILAKALNCQTGPTPTPCGTCDMCAGITSGDDVDVLEIDGASNRGIDEIRQLRQNVAIRPSRARYKIYIIDEVHMLTKDAFNALLKTLEEPPEHVKFIFATTEPSKIPLTILSRCQRFDFAGIAADQIVAKLQQIVAAEGVAADDEAIEILARRGAGSMRDAQSLLDQLLAAGQQQITATDVNTLLGIAPAARIGQLADALADGRAADALLRLDESLAEGIDTGPMMDQLLGFFRDVMVAAVGCQPQQFLFTARSQADDVVRLGSALGVARSLAILQILQQAIARFRTTLEGRTLAEVALVRIANLEQMDQLPALIAQLRSGAPTAVAASQGPPRSADRSAGSGKKKEPVTAPVPAAEPPEPQGQPVADRLATPTEPLTQATVADLWQQAIELLSSQSELVADQAKLATQVVARGSDRLVVSFAAKYTACKSFCEQPLQLAKLCEALQKVTGRPVRVDFELLDAGSSSQANAGKDQGPSRRQVLAEVTGRQFVRQAMELFDAGAPKIVPPGR